MAQSNKSPRAALRQRGGGRQQGAVEAILLQPDHARDQRAWMAERRNRAMTKTFLTLAFVVARPSSSYQGKGAATMAMKTFLALA
jgi:hypothetical protein